MKYARQMQMKRELDDRVPKGRPGDKQQTFRGCVSFYRIQGFPMEESISRATAYMQRDVPSFVPRVLPPTP